MDIHSAKRCIYINIGNGAYLVWGIYTSLTTNVSIQVCVQAAYVDNNDIVIE
jgi:hypothetical protein